MFRFLDFYLELEFGLQVSGLKPEGVAHDECGLLCELRVADRAPFAVVVHFEPAILVGSSQVENSRPSQDEN